MVAIVEKTKVLPTNANQFGFIESHGDILPTNERARLIIPDNATISLSKVYGIEADDADHDVKIHTTPSLTTIRGKDMVVGGHREPNIGGVSNFSDEGKLGPDAFGPRAIQRYGYLGVDGRVHEAQVYHANAICRTMFDVGSLGNILTPKEDDQKDLIGIDQAERNLYWLPDIEGNDGEGYGYWFIAVREYGRSSAPFPMSSVGSMAGPGFETNLCVGRIMKPGEVQLLRERIIAGNKNASINPSAIDEMANYPRSDDAAGIKISSVIGKLDANDGQDGRYNNHSNWIYALDGIKHMPRADIDFIQESKENLPYPLDVYKTLD